MSWVNGKCRDGKAGRADPLIKNVGRAHLFNPLTRISRCITRGSRRLAAGRAGCPASPQTHTQKMTLTAVE